ncbi:MULTISPECIES: CRISPR-associated helicase Cas3' [unclassified Thermosipho (in: thermotogales)]|uniref:CRISPR-associated helicase Cas3' n=1 Tax=unclassified Thermosipho (in: thermotogales) TaxID=2676525 RepID=UPI0009CEC47E|nr:MULTISPECIES: CRISPR-associated helicase Cas3' [unclassified Thermosipho (in: thermotogales)]MBT1248353.1 hypothetical protein [Thermosipho sp. 1244]OOC47484.1 hypothetical protein XO09_00580 [Thermosipho sp. 1223]
MFYARPGQSLIEHLKNVSDNMIKIVDSLPVEFEKDEIEIIKITGLMHDFGKFTTYFQNKLKNADNRYSSHSHISSIFAGLYMYYKKLSLKYIIAAMMAIRGHHGKLTDFNDLIPIKAFFEQSLNKVFENKREILFQFDDLRNKWKSIKDEFKKIGLFLPDKLIDEGFIINALRDIITEFKNFLGLSEDYNKKKLSLKTQLFYSILVDSDQKDAACIEDITRKNIPKNIVDEYVKKIGDNKLEINKIRKKFYKGVESNLFELNINKDRILTLSAPTGIGKTLSVFNFAVKLRDKISKDIGYTPRIIYALPFISIIDQVSNIFDEVLSNIEDYVERKVEYLLPYHHLATYEEDNDETIDKKLLYDSWQSEVVVTTFWQLVHTMLGYRSGILKKFYTLSGSIIILDEVQGIPIEKLEIVEEFMDLLSRELGSIFILMTATQPVFEKIRPKELNKIKKESFQIMKRTKIKKMFDTENIEELLGRVDISKKSALFVFNSIPQSINNFRILRDFFSEREIFYLSTNITPKDRIERINKIRNYLNNGKNPILVSTQVIEAGVDLDFDVVFREISSIPSIIQVAGRTNRNFRSERTCIYLTNFDERLSKKIYGSVHIQIANEILMCYGNEILEEDYESLVKKFFEKAISSISSRKSNEIISAFKELKFYNGVSNFKLIEEKPLVNIFVEKDKSDKLVFDLLVDILKQNDIFKRNKMFFKYRREIETRLLKIPVDRAKNNLPPSVEFSKNLRFINKDSLEIYYDLDTGFKFDISGESLIW